MGSIKLPVRAVRHRTECETLINTGTQRGDKEVYKGWLTGTWPVAFLGTEDLNEMKVRLAKEL